MNTKINEYVSSLMDDELDNLSDDKSLLLDKLLNEKEAHQLWHEYHLIRDCLQSQTLGHSIDIRKAVVSQLDFSKPTYKQQLNHASNHWILGGIAATICCVTLSIFFWTAAGKESNKYNNIANDYRIKMLNEDINFDYSVIAQKNRIDSNNNSKLNAESQLYLNAHQQALNMQSMREAGSLLVAQKGN